MKLKNQVSQKRNDNSKFSNMTDSLDSVSAASKSSLLSAFPNYDKNILSIEQCGFQFQNSEYENGIFAATLHFIGFFNEQSKDQYKKIVVFNILSLTNFILSKEGKYDENLCLDTSDFQINIFSGQVSQISRIIFRNYTLSTLSLPKNQKITFYSYDSSLFPLLQIPFSISQIFQFRYAALCAQYGKVYDHSIVQYFHSLMKSHDPIFNLKHIPNSLDRQQILPIFQSLTYIPTIFGISCRNNDTPSIISDISSLIEKSENIRSIKLMNCNISSGLDVFSQAISSNKILPLEELYLNDNEFEDLSPLINSFYNLQSQMTHLSLTDCGLDDSSLELLGECLLNSKSLQNLKYLGIGGAEYRESSVKSIIKYIQTNSNLVSLDLSGSQNFSPILKSIPESSITDLNLSDCIFDNESVSQLNYVAQFVTTLNITGCNMNFYEVSDVISKVGKKKDSLVSIKLNGLNFSKERSFVILRGFLLTDLEKWKSIEMNDTQISSNELFAYQALFLKMINLEHLSLNSNFKEEDAKTVASLFDIKSLKSINLANCHVASIIPNIVKSKISKINLSNNDLNDQDALNILSNPNLTSIKLNDNSFKNFDNIVQVANENPHLNEPPLKHGLSTIRRNTQYSKDFCNIISKFNIDQHTALNEDLKISYPFVQKDYEEEILEIGNPSIYNLNKLNCLTIENSSSSQQLKPVDIYPKVEFLESSSFKNAKPNKKNLNSEISSSFPKEKKNESHLSNNPVEGGKKKNKHINNYSYNSEDQYNSEEQGESKNNNFDEYDNQYDLNNQYEEDNQYDDSQFNKENQYDEDNLYDKDNQYDEDNLYDKDNQYDEDNLYDKDNIYDNDSQYDNEIEKDSQVAKKKSIKNSNINNNDTPSSLNPPKVDSPAHKQKNKKSNVNYDSSNSESVTQHNYHHKIPPNIEDELNSISENNAYNKSLPNDKNNSNNNQNKSEISENENSIPYSETDEDASWFKIPPGNQNQQLSSSSNKFREEIVNSSSTMKSSSTSPSPKSQKAQKSQKSQSKYNNQFDVDDSEEEEGKENKSDLLNPGPENKQLPAKNKTKFNFDDNEEYDDNENQSDLINPSPISENKQLPAKNISKQNFDENDDDDVSENQSDLINPSPISENKQLPAKNKPKHNFDEDDDDVNESQSDLIDPSPISENKQLPTKNKSKHDFNDDNDISENQSDLINPDPITENKQVPAKNISKHNFDNDNEFNNNINKKRDDFIQDFRRALYSSENSDNEEADQKSNSFPIEAKKEVEDEVASNSNRKQFIEQEIDIEEEEEDNSDMNSNENRFQPPKENVVNSHYENDENEDEIDSIIDENQKIKQKLRDSLSRNNKNRKSSNIINDEYENSNEEYEEQNEIEDEDRLHNYANNAKSKKNRKSDQFNITPSKPQKVSKIPTPSSSGQRRISADKEDQNDIIEDDEIPIDDEENNAPQKQQKTQRKRSRIPSPFELHQSSPTNKRRKSDIVTDNTSNFKSKIPGPRSPQRPSKTLVQLDLEKQQKQQPKQQYQEEEEEIESKQTPNQKVPRRVLFDSDDNDNDKNNNKLNGNGEGSKLVNDEENTINNLDLSSNEEPMVHKKSRTILDRHPSLSEEEEAFIRMRKMRLPRKILNQEDESENYNDTDVFSVSSNSFSPQQSPPGPSVYNDPQSKKKRMGEDRSKRSILNENENENIVDVQNSQKEYFNAPKAPEPSAEESLSSAYDFINFTSMLFAMPKKKSHNNQISPLVLAFSPPFLEDD